MIRFDNHAFKGLDESLKHLYTLLQSMGSGVEALIAMLPEALEGNSPDVFVQAKVIDKTINTAELSVDATVAAIINKFTVMGEDLRFTLATIKIAGTLERAADKIKNCAKRLSKLQHPLDGTAKRELGTAVNAVHGMIPLALAQVLDYNPEKSDALLMHGAAVQHAYRAIIVELNAHSRAADDDTHILLVAKNLEQAADLMIEIMKTCYHVHYATKYEKAGAN